MHEWALTVSLYRLGEYRRYTSRDCVPPTSFFFLNERWCTLLTNLIAINSLRTSSNVHKTLTEFETWGMTVLFYFVFIVLDTVMRRRSICTKSIDVIVIVIVINDDTNRTLFVYQYPIYRYRSKSRYPNRYPKSNTKLASVPAKCLNLTVFFSTHYNITYS